VVIASGKLAALRRPCTMWLCWTPAVDILYSSGEKVNICSGVWWMRLAQLEPQALDCSTGMIARCKDTAMCHGFIVLCTSCSGQVLLHIVPGEGQMG
jgi:hypothetical protein